MTLIPSLRRCFLATAAALSLTVAVLPGPAQAAPAPTPPVKVAIVPQQVDDRNLSHNQMEDVKMAVAIRKAAVNPKTNTLHYDKADKVDRNRVTGRRIFAAHYMWAGGHVINISKAEMAQVKRYTPKKKFPGKAAIASGHVGAAIRSCKGRTAFYSHIQGSAFWTQTWLNDCDTRTLLTVGGTASGIGAILSLFVPQAAQFVAPVAATIAIPLLFVKLAADNSNINSVIINDHWHLVWAASQ